MNENIFLAGDNPGGDRLHRTEAWVFDLDNTLYPASSNLFAQIDVRMRGFIADFLGLDLARARALQKQYFREYGTTLSGLMTRHGMEPGDFLDHVHNIDLSPIAPSPALDAALAALPGRKLIFTNGTTHHAQRIMDRLGVSHHFEGVFDIVACGYVPKPEPRVYDALVEQHGLRPEVTVMIEDIARNLKPAADLGMTTVWVRTDSDWAGAEADGGHIDHQTDDLIGWLESVPRS